MTCRGLMAIMAFLLAMQAGSPLFAADDPAQPIEKLTKKCGSPSGVVLEMPDQPGRVVAMFCDNELRALGCRPLSIIRNYLLYSYGICLNNSEMFGYAFSRKGCETPSAEFANNEKVYNQILTSGVYAMVKRVRSVEVQKNCILANEGER